VKKERIASARGSRELYENAETPPILQEKPGLKGRISITF
jgi:hypothetical protein